MTNEKLLEVALHSYLLHDLTAKLSQQGIFNLDSEYPNTYANSVGVIDEWYFSNGNFSGQIRIDRENDKPYYFDFCELEDITLCLRPISCLTKPIKVPNYNDGEEFVPIDEINRLARLSDEINFDIEWDDDDNHFVLNCAFGLGGWELPFIYDLLNKWLIDWRDLIGKGLAVSIID